MKTRRFSIASMCGAGLLGVSLAAFAGDMNKSDTMKKEMTMEEEKKMEMMKESEMKKEMTMEEEKKMEEMKSDTMDKMEK